jgi:hypothetical protein
LLLLRRQGVIAHDRGDLGIEGRRRRGVGRLSSGQIDIGVGRGRRGVQFRGGSEVSRGS